MFLGGMNSALMLLSLWILRARNEGMFRLAAERQILFQALAVAHFSQFLFNLPGALLTHGVVSLQSLRLQPLLQAHKLQPSDLVWPAPVGTMRFIFVVDFLGFALNYYCAVTAQDDK